MLLFYFFVKLLFLSIAISANKWLGQLLHSILVLLLLKSVFKNL